MRRLKLFSTPKISQTQRGEINVKIQAESPKPRLNLSIISSEDEFLSCDEMHQSKGDIAERDLNDFFLENIANISE